MKSYYYLLPKSNFFKRGYRGSVIHALGIINGFKKNKIKLTVLHGGGLNNFTNCANVQLKGVTGVFVLLKLLKKSDNRILIRYSISNLLYLGFLQRIAKNKRAICLEVNTVSKMYKQKGIFRKTVNWLESLILKKIRCIYVVSENAKVFLNKELGISNEQLVVLPNALIENTSKSVPAVSQKANVARLVYLGSLHPYYEIEEACEWIRRFNSAKNRKVIFHIYGNDDSDKAKKIKDKYAGLVKFHGSYNNKEIHNKLFIDDILLLPYKKGTIAEYGSPTKLFEYMSLKRPILASRVGQLNDILKHKENAMLYDNYASFFNSLETLLCDSVLKNKLAQESYHEVKTFHTWEMRIKELLVYWDKRNKVCS